MILDKANIFSDGQAITQTIVSNQVLDLGPGDLGPSEGASLFVNINPPFSGAGTLAVELKTADSLTDDRTNLSTVATTVAIYPLTNEILTDGGTVLAARVPHGLKRYSALNYVVTGTLADGQVTAGLALDV